MDLLDSILMLQEKYDDPDIVVKASDIKRPQSALDREMFEDANKRFNQADGGRIGFDDGGMLVQPGFGGTRQGYSKPKRTGAVPLESKGISLTKDQLNLLKKKLTPQEFRKLKFGQPRKADAYDIGVFQRYKKTDPEVISGEKKAGKKNRLFYKIQNILFPGKYETGSKIINNEKLTNKVIELTNKGKSADDITSVLMKSDKKINRNMVSSAINSLVRQNKLDDKYTVMGSTGYTKAEMAEVDNIIKKEVAKGKLGRADIGRKAEIADSYVEKWIRKNKGDKFYETNFTYEKGLLKKGTLQKQKDLFNYIETVDNISAAEIKKIFKMESGKATQKLMSDLVRQIYKMTGNSKTGSLVVPYNDEGRMRDVLGKIRNAPDFEDTYQRRIGSLVRGAYPKGPQRNQAIKSLNEYWKFSRALKKAVPELALNLDHVVPFTFLEEVKQGTNPVNLIKVKPIPRDVNLFKANFDSARIELNRLSKIDPNNPEVRKKFNLLRGLEKLTTEKTGVLFGGISQKGNVFDFKAQPIGKSDLIKDAAKSIEQYQKVARFSQDVLGDEFLQKKFKDAGVIAGKNLAMFDRVKPLSTKQIKGLSAFMEKQGIRNLENNLLKLSGQIDNDCANAIKQASKDGGRIGLQSVGSRSVCITKAKNYMNEQLQRGVGTQQNAKTSLIKRILAGSANFLKQNLSPSELLKMENLIGKPALYGAAAFETGLVADDVLRKGKPLNVSAAESLFGNILNLDADAARAKNLLESNVQLSPAAREYAQSFLDYDKYRKNELSFPASLIAKKIPGFDRYSKMQEDLKNKIENTPMTGQLDYESSLADYQDAFTAKEKFFDAPDKPGIPSFTSGQLEKRNVPGEFVMDPNFPLPLQKEILVPSYISPSYSSQRNKFQTNEFLNQYLKSVGEKPLQPGEGTLFRMNVPELGLFGANQKFAGGGIAKIAGVDQGPPPESGPNSQGLQGLMKRVKNL